MSWLLSLANKPALNLFLLILLCIPVQLGKHFWPDFAFVNGLRIDYLSPTFYLTDFLIILAFIETLPRVLKKLFSFRGIFVLLLFVFLAIVAWGSTSPSNSLLGVARLGEIVFVSLYISWFIGQKKLQAVIRTVINLSVIFVSWLTIWQSVVQSSVGGLWYFVGERTFTSVTPGIANASLHGNLVLRPYATFPHPNVLAAFLVIMLTYLLFSPFLSKPQNRLSRYLPQAAIILGMLSLILTLSRTATAVMGLILFLWILKATIKTRLQKGLTIISAVLLVMLVLQSGLITRFGSLNLGDEAVSIREFLLTQTLTMINHNFWIGVGLQNFLPVLGRQLPTSTPLAFFQPVHSLYLLLLSETGLIGLGIFIIFLGVSLFHISRSTPSTRLRKLMVLGAFLLLGTTDHYFYTLHQGQFLTAFVFGVIFAGDSLPGSNEVLSPREAKNLRTGKQAESTRKIASAHAVKIPRMRRSRQV